MSDSAVYSPARILQDDLFSIRMVSKFSLNDDTQATQIKQYIRPMATMNMNGLGIGGDAKAGDKNRELSINYLLAVSLLLGHQAVGVRACKAVAMTIKGNIADLEFGAPHLTVLLDISPPI